MKKIFYRYVLPYTYPLVLLCWFIFRPKTTNAKAVIRYGNEVLLIKNSGGITLWTLPGGGVKRGETLERAVIREVQEEVGVTIANPKQHGSIFYDGEFRRTTIWIFSAEVKSKDFTIDGLEIEEAGWFPVDALPPKKSHLLKEFLAMAEQ